MFQLTRWCALSLLLHLLAATALILLAPPESERQPQAIMVLLDRLPLPPQGGVLLAERRPRTGATPVKQLRAVGTRAPAAVHSRVILPRPAPPDLPLRSTTARSEPAASAGPEPVTEPEPERVAAGVAVSAQQASPTAGEQPARATAARASADSAGSDRARMDVARTAQEPEQAQERYLKEHFGYISELLAKRLVYPPQARRMRWSGKVLLSFGIREDGSVHGVTVLQSSGFAILDRSALETVRQVRRFPKPPVPAEIVVPINFTITP